MPRLVTPERLYLAALGLSGGAALISVALAPAERGELAASIASATLGAALGGFSIDTYLLSREPGWVVSRGRGWVAGLGLACVLLSAAVAVVLTAVTGLGSYPVAAGAAGALTVFNACASLAIRIERFSFVYTVRVITGTLLIGGYVVLYLAGERSGRAWSVAWFAVQVLGALVCAMVVLRWGVRSGVAAARSQVRGRPELRADLTAMSRLHAGFCAHMLTVRFDQILLARFAGAGPLGVYALAVAALEFAQAGAVVAAQRILARRGPDAGVPAVLTAIRPALPIAVASVLALGVLGVVRPEYDQAWLLGLCLLPGCLATCVGKTWSAVLLKRSGERATTRVAFVTLAAAVPAYLLFIPAFGAPGAALAASGVFLVYALATRAGLRRRPAGTQLLEV